MRKVQFHGSFLSYVIVFTLCAWGLPPVAWAQIGCCQTPAGCFQTNDPLVCQQFAGQFFQPATCLGGQHCQPTEPADQDGDGIPDERDACPDSLVEPTVVLGGKDSSVPNIGFDDGCMLSDLILECDSLTANHRKFVSCVAHLARELVETDALTRMEKRRLVAFVASFQDKKQCDCAVDPGMSVKKVQYVDKFSNLPTPYQDEEGKKQDKYKDMPAVEISLVLKGTIKLTGTTDAKIIVQRTLIAGQMGGITTVLWKRSKDEGKHPAPWYGEKLDGTDEAYNGPCKGGTQDLKERVVTLVLINVTKGKEYNLSFVQACDTCPVVGGEDGKKTFKFNLEWDKKTGAPKLTEQK